MDRGLNSQEVKELIDYIAENNSWNKAYTVSKNNRKLIKYYSMTTDTRTNTVWRIEFWEVSGSNINIKQHFVFRDEPHTRNPLTLKERVYQWLNEIQKD